MHVCVIYHHHYPANFSTAINEYTTHLADNGIDVTVIVGREGTEKPKQEEYRGVTVHRIDTDLSTSVSPEPTLFGYRALRRLQTIDAEVDILHLRSFPNLGLILAPPPWMDTPDVVVSDVRGTAVSNPVFETLSRWGIRVQDRLVDETVVVDDHVRRRIFPDRTDIPILPLGVDFDQFTPDGTIINRADWGFDNDDLIIGYTGNLHKSRELSRFIDGFARAHRDHPELKLVIVGDGAARSALESTARASGVADEVVFTGRVPFKEMPVYVRSFDIGGAFVADKPQYRNQPPLKTVEFLASGLPVVATDTPGNRRFADHETNGLVVADSIQQYANGLARLCAEPEFRERLGRSARESVATYDYESIVCDRLIPLYRDLCDNIKDTD